MAKKGAALSLKERRFVDAYLGSAGGNGTEAVLTAGYRQNRKVAGVTSAKLLAKASIRQEVERRQQKRANSEIADADERDRILTKIARANISVKERISAVKELNKCSGRHSIKHIHDGKLTLEQVLGESREG